MFSSIRVVDAYTRHRRAAGESHNAMSVTMTRINPHTIGANERSETLLRVAAVVSRDVALTAYP